MSARGRDRGDALPRVLPFDSRRRIAAVLERCTRTERAMLALLLYERLSTGETADALGVPAGEVERVYGGLMRRLDGALESGALPRTRRARPKDEDVELRKAS